MSTDAEPKSAPPAPHEPSTATSAPAPRWLERHRRTLLELLVMVAAVVAIRAYQSRTLRRGVVAATSTFAVSGETVTLGGASDRPRLLWFFAPWCTVCRATEHNIRALADDTEVIAVAEDAGDDDELRAFVRAQRLEGRRLRVVNDRSGAIGRRFGVRAYPTAFVLGRDGAIRSSEVGFTSELGLRARLLFAR